MSASPAAVVRKTANAFGSYESRRPKTFVKLKSGYDSGFLPPRSSPKRFPRPPPTAEKTARPRSSESSPGAYNTEAAKWKRDLADSRRKYMTEHIEQSTISLAKKNTDDKERRREGKRLREEKLTAPNSAFETMSLPSIESMILDEYPLQDPDKEERAARRVQNRLRKIARDHSSRLHQFLTIHHNSKNYATSIESLDSMLDDTIGPDKVLDQSPTFQTFTSHRFSARTKETRREVFNQILGTAANNEPGVLEISQLLEDKVSEQVSSQ